MLAALPAAACHVSIADWHVQKGDIASVTNARGVIGQRIRFTTNADGAKKLYVLSDAHKGKAIRLAIGNHRYSPIQHTPITDGTFIMELDSVEEAGYLERELKECL